MLELNYFNPNEFLLRELKKSREELSGSLLSIANEIIYKSKNPLIHKLKNFFSNPVNITFESGTNRCNVHLFTFLKVMIDLGGDGFLLEMIDGKDGEFFSSYNDLEEIVSIYKEITTITITFIQTLTNQEVDLLLTKRVEKLEENRSFYQDCCSLDSNLILRLNNNLSVDIYLPLAGAVLISDDIKGIDTALGKLIPSNHNPYFVEINTKYYKENKYSELKEVLASRIFEKMYTNVTVNWNSALLYDYVYMYPTDELNEELRVAVKIYEDDSITCIRTINNAYYVLEKNEYKGYRFKSIDQMNAALLENKWLSHQFVS